MTDVGPQVFQDPRQWSGLVPMGSGSVHDTTRTDNGFTYEEPHKISVLITGRSLLENHYSSNDKPTFRSSPWRITSRYEVYR